MKSATLTFDLSDPFEHEDLKVHLQAKDMYFALNEILELLAKNRGNSVLADPDSLFDQVYSIIKENDVDLEIYS